MPEAIARMPLDKVLRAVELTEEGTVVVVPRELTPVVSDAGDSMADWDSHKEY